MRVIKYRVAIFSIDPDRLRNFYVNILGFKQVVKVDRKDNYGYGIELTLGYKLWIARHSEVKGVNKDPFRIMLSFYVDNIDEYFSAIKKSKLSKIVEEPVISCKGIIGEERLVGSFLDPDGNCIQLMQLIEK